MVDESNNLNYEEWSNYGATLLVEGDVIPVENAHTKGSNWTAYVNVVCLLAGSGTLGITYAIKQGGWISVIILMISAIMSTYSNIKLIECLYYDRKTRKTSMSEIAYNAFGNVGMENWVYIWGIIMFVPFILLKTMKEAAWLSFSYGGNVVYPHVEASMKNPQAWPKVISLATFTVTIMYFLIGIPSYLTYGQNSLSPIYFNLPIGFSVTISIIMITAHVLLALPIYQTAFAIELENYLGITVENLGKSRELIWRIIIRTIITISMIYCAINLPYFSDFMALLGAMGNGVLLNFMPIVVWLKLFGWNQLNGWKEKFWIIFILVFSFLGAVIGTWDALKALWLDINHQ
ncbi:5434_t:CDS:2 [Diversispora eburnea]|uniref:5434_t:CDS:1 n=1 Tax=Diversispora eburnea TaxID=1213867 RepID=A0A9N9C5D9_9GLOM|nr:5434_t:CDS:2 [Diversispora eburnea]